MNEMPAGSPRVFQGEWIAADALPDPDPRAAAEMSRDHLLERLAFALHSYGVAVARMQDPEVSRQMTTHEVINASDYLAWFDGALAATSLLISSDYAEQLKRDAERLSTQYQS